MFSVLGAQNLPAWIRSAENAAQVPSLEMTAVTAVTAGKGTEPSLRQSGDNCYEVVQCSPCFVEQHPHTLHDIWAGNTPEGYLSCGELQLSPMCPLGEHLFTISTSTQVCLTDGAKDECNVVEVIGRNHENQEIAVPVANLKLSCQPLVRG